MTEEENKPEAEDTNVWLMAVDKVEIDRKEEPVSGNVDQDDLLTEDYYRVFAKPTSESGEYYRILDKQNFILSKDKPNEACLWGEIIDVNS